MNNSEQTINIESEIDNKKSDEQMHQIIESIETENPVDDLLQVQQQQEPHHQTVEVVTIETIIQVQQSAQPQAPRQQQDRVQQWQELKSNRITTQYQALDQQCLVWQECDGGVKESKPSTLSPSQFSHYIPSHH
jgi:hypothetical protein